MTSLILVFLLAAGPPQGTSPMPLRIFAPPAAGRLEPIWVSASAALDEHGKPSSELHRVDKSEIARMLETPEQDGCVHEGATIFDTVADSRVRETLESTIDTATLVFEARISGIAPGFFGGVPGQLYRLDVIKTLKGSPTRGFYYVFLQIGRFRLGPVTICKTDGEFPVEPSVNRHVIVSTSSFGGIDQELVELYVPEDIVIEGNDGAAVVARKLTDKNPRLSGATFSDVLALIEKHLVRAKGKSQ